MPYFFITGIDTGIGKTFATGLMARYLHARGISAVTQKIVQTGCVDESEDIALHGTIMGVDPLPDEKDLRCPYIFPLPASPHLAARLAGAAVEADRIARAAEELARRYEYVLIEGCGGLLVPLNDEMTQLDYIGMQQYPCAVVSSSRLGSINHTALTLEALRARNIPVTGIIYDLYPGADPLIEEDTRNTLVRQLIRSGYPGTLVDLPVFGNDEFPDIDFSAVLP